MTRATKPAMSERVRLIQLVHVAKRDIGMAEEVYRQAILEISNGRTASSGDLSIDELEALMRHFKRCGFKVRTKAGARPAKPKTGRALAGDPESRKIRALWLLLRDLGAIDNPSEAALAAYVKRMTKVDDLHWLNGRQTETVIEALKKWALRFLPEANARLLQEVRGLELTAEEQGGLVYWLKLSTRGTFDPLAGLWQFLRERLAAKAEA